MPKSQIISASITDGTISNTDIADSTLTTTKLATPNLGRRNLIINGAMNISQRKGSSSLNVVSGGTANAYVLDRWYVSASAGGATIAVQQVEDGPAGFTYSSKFTTGVVDDDGADSFNVVQQRIEGYNGNHLEFGTSNAKTVTISFWVKSSLTGTFGASLVAGNYDKMYVFQYTISSADTWEKKTVTIAGPTSGGTYYKTNSRYCVLYFDLGSGSNAEASAANNWSATGTWLYGHRISGNVKLSRNVNATWQITGVQMEVGSQSTPFEHRLYGEEFELCKRYYEYMNVGAYPCDYSSGVLGNFYWSVEKRANPTLSSVSADGGHSINLQSSYGRGGGYVYKSSKDYNSVQGLIGDAEL